MIVVSVFLLLLQQIFSQNVSQWNYKEQHSWTGSCHGNYQSPVAIIKKRTTPARFEEFQFSSCYFQPQNATITNSGHSVEVKLSNSTELSFSKGGYSGVYTFASFHFHWGSEHLVDTHRYALEGHFVHYAKKYGSLDNALKYKDGVAVLGVFYEESQRSNKAFDKIIGAISVVGHKIKRPVSLGRSVVVHDFFPADTSTFYRYNGSLTTPKCDESVVWTLFAKPANISRAQVKKFAQIWDEDNRALTRNYRDVQCLNGRQILYQGK